MKILLVQNSFLGDTILSTPVIEALSKRYGGSEIWMMTTPLSGFLVKHDPLLSGVITFDKRGKHRGLSGLKVMAGQLKTHAFDKVYSLHRSWRTSLLLWMSGIPSRVGFKNSSLSWLYTDLVQRSIGGHEVERNLSLLASSTVKSVEGGELRLFIPNSLSISKEVSSFLSGGGEFVLLFPGSVWETKRWHEEGYRALAQKIAQLGIRVLILGAPAETTICRRVSEGIDVIDLSGKVSLEETMLLVKNAKGVVCNDSMPLHMASTFKVPTVTIFCATSPEFGFGPWRNKAIVVEHQGLSCKPCRRHGSNECPVGTFRCGKDVPVEEVFEALRGIWVN